LAFSLRHVCETAPLESDGYELHGVSQFMPEESPTTAGIVGNGSV
jgi:hypothetical protein